MLFIPALTSAATAYIGYRNYKKGMEEAKRIDAMGLESKADAILPEYRDLQASYQRTADVGLSSSEVNQFMKQAQSSMYAQQMGAQTMAGGSLARYTLAMNNANYLNQMGILAGQQFQRKMEGARGVERIAGIRQQAVFSDIDLENMKRQQAGAAAAARAQQGMRDVIGSIAGFGQMAHQSEMQKDQQKADMSAQVVGAFLAGGSDIRLKKNIEKIDNIKGINVYKFQYINGDGTVYIGVMAQELIGTCYEKSIIINDDGFMSVDYSVLPINFVRYNDFLNNGVSYKNNE